MRSAFLFTTILLLAIVPSTNPATASGLDENSGITITASFDNSIEMTTLDITMPVTNNATLLDELKDETFSIFRLVAGDYPVYIESIATNIQFCTQGMSNSECSGATFQIEHFPSPFDHDDFEYVLEFGNNGIHWIISNSVEEAVSPVMAVDNLTGMYSDDITTLSWDYIEPDFPMNHSVMIYSHDSPATRENWNSMAKTIVSSSVPAGSTTFEINHSSNQVEREIYYSVTLLFETSEDTRFLGSNTLTEPVTEDNTPPLFIGELTASFDSETATTSLDWEEGVLDDDLSINIYRHDSELELINPSNLVATVDASTSTFDVEIPFGEHRKTSYAITLVDSEGNEILTLTESSPVSNPVIESTISTTTATSLNAERFGDGTIVISWADNTQNPNAMARVWRSVTGPIESLENVEELATTNLSNEQFSHNPINAQDQAWYAITIDAAWGSEEVPWHDDRLFIGLNSMQNPIRETQEEVEETVVDFNSQVLTSSGFRANLSDGSVITLGPMYEGEMVIISTSSIVENITCYDVAGQGTSIGSNSDWSLSFDANQSGEKCLGLIVDGEDEIGFTLTWNYVEPVIDRDNDDDDDDDDDDEHRGRGDHDDDNEEVTGIILGLVIIILLVYLFAMMRSPKPEKLYFEEE